MTVSILNVDNEHDKQPSYEQEERQEKHRPINI